MLHVDDHHAPYATSDLPSLGHLKITKGATMVRQQMQVLLQLILVHFSIQ